LHLVGRIVKMMHGTMNVKFKNAKQAKGMHTYKNIKRKLYRTIAAIWFNKTWSDKQLTHNFINLRINGKNRQCTNTIRAAIHFRLNQEIQFLYIKSSQGTINYPTQLYLVGHFQ
jgi:predicted phage tail protein